MPCDVIFVTGGGDKRHFVTVDLEPQEVARRLSAAKGFEQMQTTSGKSVWINPDNVACVQERAKGRVAAF